MALSLQKNVFWGLICAGVGNFSLQLISFDEGVLQACILSLGYYGHVGMLAILVAIVASMIDRGMWQKVCYWFCSIGSTMHTNNLGWENALQFEEGIEKTVRWYLDNQEWMDNITSCEYEKYYAEMYKGKVL